MNLWIVILWMNYNSLYKKKLKMKEWTSAITAHGIYGWAMMQRHHVKNA